MQGARPKRVIIMGAGGRDFHNFNVYFRGRREYEVVAFTASQIPNIDNRTYPPELAGPLYPGGIPIYPESQLEELIGKFDVEEVILSYSDLLCTDMLAKLSRVLAAGAHFRILSVKDTMLDSKKPVVAITAVRTGAGKSSTARRVVRLLRERGLRPVVVRHPMAYGDLTKMKVQKFSSLEDLDSLAYTIEEKEEYEWHILEGNTVYAGVDYEAVLREVEEGPYDVIVWDGGNNDWPFIRPNLYITVVDPTRPGHEVSSFPGLVNLLMADVVLVNKANMVSREIVDEVVRRVKRVNPRARVIIAASEVTVDRPEEVRGHKVLVVEDGPSVTHGHMSYGAGYVAAQKYGAAEVVDPRPYAVGSLRGVYAKYRHIGAVLPAMGYGEKQVKELEETINKVPADVVVLGTPTDISRYLRINKSVVRVRYEIRELEGSLAAVIDEFIAGIESSGGVRGAVR